MSTSILKHGLRRPLALCTIAALVAGASDTHGQTPVRRPDQVLRIEGADDTDLFGASVASDGPWVAVAAPGGDNGAIGAAGSVSIYRRVGTDLEFVAERYSGSEQNAQSARWVDIRHGILAVASSHPPPSGPSELKGQCAIFDLEDPTIPQIGSIRPDRRVLGPVNGAALGSQVVVLDRDHVAIQNRGYEPGLMPNGEIIPLGAVFVYQRGPSGWTVKQAVVPGRDFFGFPDPPPQHSTNASTRGIDFDGERLVAGARKSFSVYEWGPDQLLHPTVAVEGHIPSEQTEFGYSIAIQDDLVAVGTWGAVNAPYLARVQVYRETNGVWAREATLLPSDGFATRPGLTWVNSRFGQRIAIDERGRILVGATYGQRADSPDPPVDELPGSAYLFEEEPNGWEERFRFWGSSDENDAELGIGLAFAGDMVVAGAPRSSPENSFLNVGNANAYLIPLGEEACVGQLNSTGEAASIEVVGDRDVSYGSLGVRALGLPVAAPSMLIASRQTAFLPNPGTSSGNLCLGGAIARFVGSVDLADGDGRAEFAVPGLLVPTPSGPETIEAGDSWTFQVWYRDNAPNPTSNFTSAVRVEFD